MASSSESISFRARREIKEALEEAARKSGQTVTDYLRSLVEDALNGEEQRARSLNNLQEELIELRRDLAAGLEALGVMVCRMLRTVTPEGEARAVEREFRAWVEENLRHA